MAKVVESHEACPWLMRPNVSRGAGVGGTGMAGRHTQGGMRPPVAVDRLPRTSPVCIGPHTPLPIAQSRLYRAAYPPTYLSVPFV